MTSECDACSTVFAQSLLFSAFFCRRILHDRDRFDFNLNRKIIWIFYFTVVCPNKWVSSFWWEQTEIQICKLHLFIFIIYRCYTFRKITNIFHHGTWMYKCIQSNFLQNIHHSPYQLDLITLRFGTCTICPYWSLVCTIRFAGQLHFNSSLL